MPSFFLHAPKYLLLKVFAFLVAAGDPGAAVLVVLARVSEPFVGGSSNRNGSDASRSAFCLLAASDLPSVVTKAGVVDVWLSISAVRDRKSVV